MPAPPRPSATPGSCVRQVLAWRVFLVVLVVLGLSPTAIRAAAAAADDSRWAVRWWEDAAVAMPPAANVARFAVLSEVSDDQFAAWLGVLDDHRAAIDALIVEAEASGPVVYRPDDDQLMTLRRGVEAGERRARLRRRMEPLRDRLLERLLEPLTERQRLRAMPWRNLILVEVELVRPEFFGAGPIEWIAMEQVLADMAIGGGNAERLGALLSATADSRRAMAVEVGVRGGGFNTIVRREAVAAMEAGATWQEAFVAVAVEPSSGVRRRLQTMQRYRTMVLDVLEHLDGLGLSRSFSDEAKARLLARAQSALASPGSVIAGAAQLLATESDPEIRAELERLSDAAIQSAIEFLRTARSAFEYRAAPQTPEQQAAWRARLDATRAPLSPLSKRVRALGGGFPSLESSMHMIVRPDQLDPQSTGGDPASAVAMGAATGVVATALASDLGWSREEALATARELADGKRLHDVAKWPDTERAGLSADLLQAVADGERFVVAATEAWSSDPSHRIGVSPAEQWGNAPLTAWVLATADDDERTTVRLRRLLQFERDRVIRLEASHAAAETAGPLDRDDRAAVSARVTAAAEEAQRGGAVMTAALTDVTQEAPRLTTALHEVIDRQRIGWLLARHRALETLLARVESELRLNPARRLALSDAGTALRAVARRTGLWVGDMADPDSMTARDHTARAFIVANRIWTRHAFAAEVIRIRRELLAR